MYKLKKALPFITAAALSVALWTFFAMWIVNVYKASYDLMTIIVGTIVVIVFAGSTTWESIRAYREWRKKK
jgi:TctA family transporter